MDLNRINNTNLREFSAELCQGEGGWVHTESDVVRLYTGRPILSRVMLARFPDEYAEARIDQVLAGFPSPGTSINWITSPDTEPADLGQRLMARGFRWFGWSAMAVDFDDLPRDLSRPDGLMVIEVTSESDMHMWSHVVYAGFGMREGFLPEFDALFAGLGGTRMHHYLGSLDGEPCTACTIFDGSESAGVYLVATLPQARGQGLARWMTTYGLLESEPRGYQLGVLQASTMGEPVYRAIGFEEHCRMDVYPIVTG